MKKPITLDGKNHYFLCSWNEIAYDTSIGDFRVHYTKCVQIHTKETLIKECKKTNLGEGNDWQTAWTGDPNLDKIKTSGLSFLELLDWLIENNDVLNIYNNDNMSIQYIKEKE